MKKIVITKKLPGNPEKLLIEKGYDVSIIPEKIWSSKERLLKKFQTADAIISTVSDKIDKEIIDVAANCKIIANFGVGYNNIDVEYSRAKNIIVTNTPDVLTDSTADLTVGLILACSRRFYEGELIVRSKKYFGWEPDMLLGFEIKNKKLGIIGAGRIGQAVAKRMKSFGADIIYFSRSKKTNFEKETGAKKVSLNFLLKNSDIISVNLPLTNSTTKILNRDNLKFLKPSAVFVNTSRGEVIDEQFLIQLLKKKKIFAAGFDVYQNEPAVNNELLKLKNTFLLPHLGSATFEARSGMSFLCVNNVISVLSGKGPITPV